MTDAVLATLYAALIAAALACAAYCLWAVRRAWRSASPAGRKAAVVSTAAFVLAGWALSALAPVRAGRHNEHALWFLANAPLTSPDLRDLFEEREAAPRVLLALFEAVAGRSLERVLLFQTACWWLSGAFLFAALMRLGAGPAGAAAGAGLFVLNFHALLMARSFAPDVASLPLCAMAVWALAELSQERDRAAAGRAAAFFGCSLLLVFLSKFEIGAALAAGGALVLAVRRRRPSAAALLAAAAAAGLVAAFLASGITVFGKKLFPFEPVGPAELAVSAIANLHRHLVESNLGELAGTAPPAWAAAAAVAAALGAAARVAGPAWAAALAAWIGLLACLYMPFSIYPASHSRHHLAVFMPVCLLAGLLAGRLAAAVRPRGWAAAGVTAFLAAYAGAGLGRVREYAAAPRTSDRELAFLLEARRDWPVGCAAVDPEPGLRRRVLAKYFPGWSEGQPAPRCALVYRRPETLLRTTTPAADLSGLGLVPWKQTVFRHAYFTDWHGPWDWDKFERLDAFETRAAFDRLPDGRWYELRARLAAATPRTGQKAPERWARAAQHPLDLAYRRSPEACYKQRLSTALKPGPWAAASWSPPEAALACFEQAERRAQAEGHAADLAHLLASRASLERALGRHDRARRAFAAARRAAAQSGQAADRAAFLGRGLDGI